MARPPRRMKGFPKRTMAISPDEIYHIATMKYEKRPDKAGRIKLTGKEVYEMVRSMSRRDITRISDPRTRARLSRILTKTYRGVVRKKVKDMTDMLRRSGMSVSKKEELIDFPSIFEEEKEFGVKRRQLRRWIRRTNVKPSRR